MTNVKQEPEDSDQSHTMNSYATDFGQNAPNRYFEGHYVSSRERSNELKLPPTMSCMMYRQLRHYSSEKSCTPTDDRDAKATTRTPNITATKSCNTNRLSKKPRHTRLSRREATRRERERVGKIRMAYKQLQAVLGMDNRGRPKYLEILRGAINAIEQYERCLGYR